MTCFAVDSPCASGYHDGEQTTKDTVWLLLPPAWLSNRCFGNASSTRRSQPPCRSSGPAATRVPRRGCRRLDAQLRGGVPRGQVSEIVGPRSSGRTSVLRALMATATRRGELVALIDTLDRFDPASAVAAGVDLARLLWVRGQDVPLTQLALAPGWEPSRPRSGRTRDSVVARALDRAIKAVNLVLQSGGFGLVALDIADVPLDALRELPFNTWMRLQRVVDASDTACVLVGDVPSARSAKGVSIRLQPQRSRRETVRSGGRERPRSRARARARRRHATRRDRAGTRGCPSMVPAPRPRCPAPCRHGKGLRPTRFTRRCSPAAARSCRARAAAA